MDPKDVIKVEDFTKKKASIEMCIEKCLYRDNILFRKNVDKILSDERRVRYNFNVYFSGENIDTIRVEITPFEEDGAVSIQCFIPAIIPNDCNEEALDKECKKFNRLYGDHSYFCFLKSDGHEDARVFISHNLKMEEDDSESDQLCVCTTPRELAEWTVMDAEEMAKIVDHAFPSLLYAAWLKADEMEENK